MLRESHILLFSIFIAGLCSIVYELLIATTGSYFLGDSITQFSLTIGVYMAFMGVGSYLSRFVKDDKLLAQFIGFELLLALCGGLSVPLLYLAYALDISVQATSVTLTAVIGTLIGLEIPLLSRLMEKHYSLKANLSNVLSIDYFGALLATLLFPFIFLPWLGIFKTSLMFGLINLSIALSLLWYFSSQIMDKPKYQLRMALILVSVILIGTMASSARLNKAWNGHVFDDPVVHSEQTQYQQIVMTRHKNDVRLYLNGGLQFSSIDEYRYHEVLVHPAMQRRDNIKNVLVLGGGDGLAVREVLKYADVEHVTLVDLDPAVARLARENHYLKDLNANALNSEKVSVWHGDAMVFLQQIKRKFDLVIVDLPDPKTVSLARLYSLQFYRLIGRALTPSGIFVTQATSPFFAKEAFWSIRNTVAASGMKDVKTFFANVPSFGEWGFVMGCQSNCQKPLKFEHISTRFYHHELDSAMQVLAGDQKVDKEVVSTLDRPNVLYLYLDGWRYWN
ncbi:polyamine aminopropyltransferase [Pseudoalteromonas luteoviolacea]|uniref:polyamine aminopropyltransferase n=1 Tax=Pseudoalteromonas luteoviolacea TaxID=43657 RepID=UPI001B39824D|nr:polyamine aminopropyltransferase [Pseudoalteromonas luteoviolacea]MBQ4835871.1 polyamine aminopropyltransferase [Pseudoalteromonas luteoviolacea]